MELLATFIPIAIAAIVIIFLLIFFSTGYVKAPPDQAYIISGLRKESRILIGRAGIRIPFLERLDKLYLGQMTVDIKTGLPVPTNDFINVDVDAVAKVRISPTPDGIKLAAKNFLNKKSIDITKDLQDSLQGNLREIIGTLSLKEINTDRDSFSDQVMCKASTDMQKLGIEILSCNIQNVSDENGLIRDLGADNTSRIKKDASIAKAQADRDVAIAQAEAEKSANDARVLAQTEIAQKNNELEIKQAELKILADSKRAEADAAYEIRSQEQRKSIETATVNAEIARAERDAELKRQEVEVTRQKLDADVRAQADAERYATEQAAQAALFKLQKEAEGITAIGRAEAEAIRAKVLAEAEGIDKKAEAMKKYGEAAVVEIIMNALPQIAKNVAEPLAKVDKITMYGSDNSTKLLQDIVNGTNQVTEGLTQGMGINLQALIAGLLGGKMAANDQPIVVHAPAVSGSDPDSPDL